jgi:cystathionine beta-lyase
MDYAACPAVTEAVGAAVRRGHFGYPSPAATARLRTATAAFAARRLKWAVDPGLVLATGDIMDGIRLALTTLCDDGPVVVPTPAYPPFLDAVPLAGRQLVPIPLDPDSGRATLDLGRIDAA